MIEVRIIGEWDEVEKFISYVKQIHAVEVQWESMPYKAKNAQNKRVYMEIQIDKDACLLTCPINSGCICNNGLKLHECEVTKAVGLEGIKDLIHIRGD